MWNPGEAIVWRGVFRNRVWHAQTVLVVKDSPEEIVLALLPGTECMAPEGYLQGKQTDKRRWNFKEKDWALERYDWRTNRLLLLLKPEKFHSTIFFWNQERDEFLCYYINFQLPFQRNLYGVDTLDLDLDLIINPDFSYEWKDEKDYQDAIDHGVILLEWKRSIAADTDEIFEKFQSRQYPFDGAWLDWRPDPDWSPPRLPKGWDKL